MSSAQTAYKCFRLCRYKSDLPADDASNAFDASAATANSSNCDLQSLDEIPVISPSDLAAVLAA